MKKMNISIIIMVLLCFSLILNMCQYVNRQDHNAQSNNQILLPMESDYTVFTLKNIEEKDNEYIIDYQVNLSDIGNQLNELNILDNEIQLNVAVYFSNEPSFGTVTFTDEQTIVEDNWIHAAPITVTCGKDPVQYVAKIDKSQLSNQENETIHNVLNGQHYEYQSIYCTINQYGKEVVVHEATFK